LGEVLQVKTKLVLIGRLCASTALTLLAVPVVAGACPNETSPGFRSYLPDCRAYELVSPAYTEGFPVETAEPIGISEDGEELHVISLGSFSEPDNTSFFGETYRVERGTTEWKASPLGASFFTFPHYTIEGMSTNFEGSLVFASVPGESLTGVYFAPTDGNPTLVGPGGPLGVRESGLRYVGASDELHNALLSDNSPRAGKEDRLWPGDTTVGEGEPSLYEYEGIGNFEPRLVGVSNEERLEKAAVKEGRPHINEAANLISNCGTSLGSAGQKDAYNAVSESGTTVFFTAEAGEGCSTPGVNELYARINGERTLAISEPTHPLVQGSGSGPEECNPACATALHEPAEFRGASEDGSKVFFLTSQPLLNSDEDSDTDLYEAEIEGQGVGEHPRIGRLIQVSHNPNPGQAAEVQGVARVSEDGSHVYFVAEGRLTSEPRGGGKVGVDEGLGAEGVCLASLNQAERAEEAKAEEQEAKEEEVIFGARCRPKKDSENLYVYERDALYPHGHTAFVATLLGSDGADWLEEDARPVQATPDGRFLVFQSAADLTADEERRAEAGQVFEYDAETGALVRVSQGEDGYNEDGNTAVYSATIPIQYREYSIPERHFNHLAVSEDGSRVFFSSPEALTPQAQALNGVCISSRNGSCVSYAENIYEYHGGQISLISDGHDDLSVNNNPVGNLIGTDESGKDAFFTTADRLVPQDTNVQAAIYDAREDGGFPAAEEPVPCSGDSCQGAASEPPSLLAPMTSAVAAEGAGSPLGVTVLAKPKAKPKKSKPKKIKGRKRKLKSKRAAERKR
jgi:hypothetical protein